MTLILLGYSLCIFPVDYLMPIPVFIIFLASFFNLLSTEVKDVLFFIATLIFYSFYIGSFWWRFKKRILIFLSIGWLGLILYIYLHPTMFGTKDDFNTKFTGIIISTGFYILTSIIALIYLIRVSLNPKSSIKK